MDREPRIRVDCSMGARSWPTPGEGRAARQPVAKPVFGPNLANLSTELAIRRLALSRRPHEFLSTVQQCGAAVIEARGSSSAASAANAVVDTVRALTTPIPAGD